MELEDVNREQNSETSADMTVLVKKKKIQMKVHCYLKFFEKNRNYKIKNVEVKHLSAETKNLLARRGKRKIISDTPLNLPIRANENLFFFCNYRYQLY